MTGFLEGKCYNKLMQKYQNNKKYGKIFKEIREAHELSQDYFTILGITAATISNFEKGKTMMKIDLLDSAVRRIRNIE